MWGHLDVSEEHRLGGILDIIFDIEYSPGKFSFLLDMIEVEESLLSWWITLTISTFKDVSITVPWPECGEALVPREHQPIKYKWKKSVIPPFV